MDILLVVKEQLSSSALVQWSLRLAGSKTAKLYVLRVLDGEKVGTADWNSECDPAWWGDIHSTVADHEGVEVICGELKTVNTTKSVLAQVSALKVQLVVLQDRLSHPEHYRKSIQNLMEAVPCALMILRLGEGDTGKGKVLLPCAGGPNSRRGLKIAADAFGVDVTAFFVEPDVDELSIEVGEKRLDRFLKRSGVNAEAVTQRAVVHDNVYDAIREEISSQDYGMLLIGASGVGSVRRKLFGTVPDRFLKGSEAMSVGVIRGEKPLGQKMRRYFERMLLLNIPQLQRSERISLFEEMEEKSRWSFDFAALMILATAIAALGLLSNSGAVVIGAMLVAPLMTPLLGGGLAVVQGNWPLWKRCQKAVGLGFVAALAVGLVLGFIAKMAGLGLTDELLSRGAPSLLDLGVAFISGVAASYCLARPKLSGALAGVAIAAALVPPIATTGICIALEKYTVANGAAMLFGTNVVAIVFGSAANFFIAGIRGRDSLSRVWAKRVMIVFALILLGLLVPLTSTIVKKVAGDDTLVEQLNAVAGSHSVTVSQLRKMPPSKGVQVYEVTVDADEKVSSSLAAEFQRVAEQYSKREIKIRVITRLVTQPQ